MPDEPLVTLGTPASAPAPARKWNCRSGIGALLSANQKAPPSTTFEVIGPERDHRVIQKLSSGAGTFVNGPDHRSKRLPVLIVVHSLQCRLGMRAHCGQRRGHPVRRVRDKILGLGQ